MAKLKEIENLIGQDMAIQAPNSRWSATTTGEIIGIDRTRRRGSNYGWVETPRVAYYRTRNGVRLANAEGHPVVDYCPLSHVSPGYTAAMLRQQEAEAEESRARHLERKQAAAASIADSVAKLIEAGVFADHYDGPAPKAPYVSKYDSNLTLDAEQLAALTAAALA